MKQTLHYILAISVLVAVFSGSLAAEVTTPILSEARGYSLTEGQGTDYPSTTTVTIFPRKDGQFDVSVSIVNKHEWEFFGTGRMEKDGCIHFPWVDNFRRKGNGEVQLLDNGTKATLNPKSFSPNSPSILPWTREQVLGNRRTTPGGYLVHLPGTYENRDASVSVRLDPARADHVKVSVQAPFGSKSSDSISIDGTGTWEDGDILHFVGTDFPDHNPAKGQLHFINANKAIMTLTKVSTKNPTQKARIQQFNTHQLVLERYLPNDEGVSKDIGW